MPRALATKAKIETSAIKLFAEKGVDQTTTRDIAAGAGISEGAIYRHFEGKDAMVHELFSANYLRLAGELDELQGRETGLRRKLAAMVRAFCVLFEEDPDMFRFLLLVQHGEIQKMPPDARTPVRVVRGVIEDAIQRGEIPAQDPDVANALVFGVVLQPALFKVYGQIGEPMTALSERLSEACWLTLGGSA
ncbi:MAG: TetR/AcrR family transcriptional regulator [Kiloniellales bacterium]|nr:TetR/AcrR family transcriptional regulator [Kiloniellales bacterium]